MIYTVLCLILAFVEYACSNSTEHCSLQVQSIKWQNYVAKSRIKTQKYFLFSLEDACLRIRIPFFPAQGLAPQRTFIFLP